MYGVFVNDETCVCLVHEKMYFNSDRFMVPKIYYWKW